jgi:hypothetical protein
MGSIIQAIADYIGQSALLTLQHLTLLLGPVLILAFVLDQLSQFIRARGARLFGLDAYIYLTAPGVMIHELGHAFFCVIFRHRIVRMQLFAPTGDGTLGSVEHAYNRRSTYQRIGNFFIGTGPIWFGTVMICLLAWLLLGPAARNVADHLAIAADTSNGAPNGALGLDAIVSQVAALTWQLILSLAQPAIISTWQFWIFAYLMFCIGSHITLSRPDINGAARGFVSLVAFVFLFNLLTLSFGQQFSLRACQRVLQGAVIFYAAMSLVVCLNLALAMILLVLSSVRRGR